MGIIIGSCMAKETSVASIGIPVFAANAPPNEGNVSGEARDPLRLLMVNGETHSTGDNQQYRMARALLRPIPYNYIHGGGGGGDGSSSSTSTTSTSSHPLSRDAQHANSRRVVQHGEPC